MAQKEIAKQVGIGGSILEGKRSKGEFISCKSFVLEELILEEDLVNLMPNVYRANAMAKELKRNVNFEIVLMAPESRGLNEGLTEVSRLSYLAFVFIDLD